MPGFLRIPDRKIITWPYWTICSQSINYSFLFLSKDISDGKKRYNGENNQPRPCSLHLRLHFMSTFSIIAGDSYRQWGWNISAKVEIEIEKRVTLCSHLTGWFLIGCMDLQSGLEGIQSHFFVSSCVVFITATGVAVTSQKSRMIYFTSKDFKTNTKNKSLYWYFEKAEPS